MGGEDDTSDHEPNPIDRHVGLAIRRRRNELNMTQEALAEGAGVSFQQVQKYERGANRVSASRLWRMARVLRCPITYFYDGLEEDAEPAAPPPSPVVELMYSAQGRELIRAFSEMPAGPIKRRILDLMRAVAEEMAARGPAAEPAPEAAAEP